MSTGTPHVLAEHRRSPALDDLFVVDMDVHINDSAADLIPYMELPWRKSLEISASAPQRYLDTPGFAPQFVPWALMSTIERRTTVTERTAASTDSASRT